MIRNRWIEAMHIVASQQEKIRTLRKLVRPGGVNFAVLSAINVEQSHARPAMNDLNEIVWC